MSWKAMWRGARRITDDRLADMVRPAPEERLHWTAWAWPVVLVGGALVYGMYCR